MAIERQHEGPLWPWKCSAPWLYLWDIAGTVCCSSANCYHQRRLAKGHVMHLCVISYNCMSTYHYLRNKSLLSKKMSDSPSSPSGPQNLVEQFGH